MHKHIKRVRLVRKNLDELPQDELHDFIGEVSALLWKAKGRIRRRRSKVAAKTRSDDLTLLSVKEVSKEFGITPDALYRHARRKELPPLQVAANIETVRDLALLGAATNPEAFDAYLRQAPPRTAYKLGREVAEFTVRHHDLYLPRLAYPESFAN